MADKKKEPSIVLGLAFFVMMMILVSVNAVIGFMAKHPITDAVITKVNNDYVIPANNFYNTIGFTMVSNIINTEFKKFEANGKIANIKQNSIECQKINHKFNTFQVIGTYFGLKNNKDYCGAIPTVSAYMELNPVIFLSNFRFDMMALFAIIFLIIIAVFIIYRKLVREKNKVDNEILRFFAFIPPDSQLDDKQQDKTKDKLEEFLNEFVITNPLNRQDKIINIDKLREFVSDVMQGRYDKLAQENKRLLEKQKDYKFAQKSAKIMRYMKASLVGEKMTGDAPPASVTGYHNPDVKYGLLTHSLNVAYITMLNLLKNTHTTNADKSETAKKARENYLEYFYGAISHDADKMRNYRQRKAMPQNIIDASDATGKKTKEITAKMLKARENEWTSYGLNELAQRNIFIQHCTGLFPSKEVERYVKQCEYWAINSEFMFTGLDKKERHELLLAILINTLTYERFYKQLTINTTTDDTPDGKITTDIVLADYIDNPTAVFTESFFEKLSKILQEEFDNRRVDYQLSLKIPLMAGKNALMKMYAFYFYEIMMDNFNEIKLKDNDKDSFAKSFYPKNKLKYDGNTIEEEITKVICVKKLEEIKKILEKSKNNRFEI